LDGVESHDDLYSDPVTGTEVAVWTKAQGGAPIRGVVVKRGGPKALIHVQWDEGTIEKVRPDNPAVHFAYEDTRRLEWLLNPRELVDQFKADPVGVFESVIRDEKHKIGTAQIKRRLVDLGLDPRRVEAAFEDARPKLRANRHIVIEGAGHRWSEVPVDPYADLRQLPPHAALDRLLTTPRLSKEKKEALADAIRAALPPR
jgi:hypothetical protein